MSNVTEWVSVKWAQPHSRRQTRGDEVASTKNVTKQTEAKQKHKHTEKHNTKQKHTDMKCQGAKMSHAWVKLTEGNQTHMKQTNKIEEYFVSNTRVLQKDNF